MRIAAKMRVLAFFVILATFVSIIKYANAYIPCMCNNPPEQCTCFIQLGDKGLAVKLIIGRLQKKGYLGKVEKKNEFSPEVKQAVIKFQSDNNLECTGWMDDDTLNTMLYNSLPDKKVKYTADFWDDICFVPTDGGQKYHSNPGCSDMINPRMISRVNAECLGISPCGKWSCGLPSSLKFSSYNLTPRKLPDEYYIVDEDHEASFSEETLNKPDDGVTERLASFDDVEMIYIGNKNSHVFHRGNCKSVTDMKDKNKISFQTRDEAIEKGYKPCSRCKP